MKPGLAFAKRAVDVTVAFIGLILLSPLLVLTAILIKLDSPGPVLYPSVRMGRHGRPFLMRKFRTMAQGSPALHNPDGSMRVDRNDPRVTRVGRVLRLGFDELPQLLNVLKGDMSLIGPRPDPPEALQHYGEEDRRRLLVRPGMTGLAQVAGRTDIPWRERLAYDLQYVEHLSLGLDARIAFYTAFEFVPPLRRRFAARRAEIFPRPTGSARGADEEKGDDRR